MLKVNRSAGGPVLNVFGGKITTYRCLAESALEIIDEEFQRKTKKWTAAAAMPGGDFPLDGVNDLRIALAKALPFLPTKTIIRLIRQYGTDAMIIFRGCDTVDALGKDFGHGVFQHELDWAIAHEWVMQSDDFLWRRSKLGLRFNATETKEIGDYIRHQHAHDD